MQTLEHLTHNLTHNSSIVEYVGQQPYDGLLHNAIELAGECHIGGVLQDKTFELLDELCAYDEDVALGGLRTLPIALGVAEEIGSFYGIEVDKSSVFVGSLLHDIGKIALPKELLVKSSAGQEWTLPDALAMRQHVELGGMLLRYQGMPTTVVRLVEEHHHKQMGGNEYGVDPHLNNEERVCRDGVAIADFAEADINRTNTRNRDLTQLQREQEVVADITYVLNDYSDALYLANRIAHRIFGFN